MTARRPSLRATLASACALVALAPAADAGVSRGTDVQERFRGADRVVVARVARVQPRWTRTPQGDELIVSDTTLSVEETLKGKAERGVVVEIEGGTINGLTLHVSDLPGLTGGERGVFLLKRGGGGRLLPHLRGQGILLLDAQDRVRGSGLDLSTIRKMAGAGR